MDAARFSAIAHRAHALWNPLSDAKVDRVLGLLALPRGGRVLDVGCGAGEVLLRLAERRGARGLGVDASPHALAEARARQAARGAAGALVELRQGDAGELRFDEGAFDLAVCVGSTHALGGFRPALRWLRRAVRPGGEILVGEGFWAHPPEDEYLAFLGASTDEHTTHPGNERAGAEEGLVPLYSTTSSVDEWDDYEGRYLLAVERHVAAHPDDPDASEMLARVRRWRDGYLRWGRATLGFGLYVFRV